MTILPDPGFISEADQLMASFRDEVSDVIGKDGGGVGSVESFVRLINQVMQHDDPITLLAVMSNREGVNVLLKLMARASMVGLSQSMLGIEE